jgi:hypothetical protein
MLPEMIYPLEQLPPPISVLSQVKHRFLELIETEAHKVDLQHGETIYEKSRAAQGDWRLGIHMNNSINVYDVGPPHRPWAQNLRNLHEILTVA